jgi:hypothetical protein
MQLSSFIIYTWLLNDQTHIFSLSYWYVLFLLTYSSFLIGIPRKRRVRHTRCSLWFNVPSTECTQENKKILKNHIFSLAHLPLNFMYFTIFELQVYYLEREDGCNDEIVAM